MSDFKEWWDKESGWGDAEKRAEYQLAKNAWDKACESQVATIQRLRDELDSLKKTLCYHVDLGMEAETENQRLRDALEEIKNGRFYEISGPKYPPAPVIAKQALQEAEQ